jgi:hypothetical protein
MIHKEMFLTGLSISLFSCATYQEASYGVGGLAHVIKTSKILGSLFDLD